MSGSCTAGALDEGPYSRTSNIRQLSGQNQLPPNVSREVNTITEATEEWATSRNYRRAQLRSVMTINALTKRQKHDEDWQINFSAHEENIVKDNSNNPLIISYIINNYLVERILENDGSEIEVLIDMYEK